MPIKTITDITSHSTEWLKLKTVKASKVGENPEQWEHSDITGRGIKLFNISENHILVSSFF